jgi:hypothetical protein
VQHALAGRKLSMACVAADSTHPAADVAGQTATALAMLAQWFKVSEGSTAADRDTLVPVLTAKAKAAYAYAERMVKDFPGAGATCSQSVRPPLCSGVACYARRHVSKWRVFASERLVC